MLIAESAAGLVLASNAHPHTHYWCPACQSRVQLRRGKLKVAHFAHLPGADCNVSEGETAEHLTGKQQLWHWLRLCGYQPQLEVYLPAIKQRPDLLFRDQQQRLIAVEFQCSPLSIERLQERNQGYLQLGIYPWWLLGKPYRHHLSKKKQAQFTQRVTGQLTLLYWDTAKQSIKYVSDPPRCSFTGRIKDRVLIIQNQIYHLQRPLPVTSQVKQLVQLVGTRLGPRPLACCPLVCHDTQPSWPAMVGELIYWRIKVVVCLNDLPLFSAWTLDEWYRWLIQLGQPNWLAFPCLVRPPYRPVCDQYSQELLTAGVIKLIGGQVVLFQHPRWFNNLAPKLAALDQSC